MKVNYILSFFLFFCSNLHFAQTGKSLKTLEKEYERSIHQRDSLKSRFETQNNQQVIDSTNFQNGVLNAADSAQLIWTHIQIVNQIQTDFSRLKDHDLGLKFELNYPGELTPFKTSKIRWVCYWEEMNFTTPPVYTVRMDQELKKDQRMLYYDSSIQVLTAENLLWENLLVRQDSLIKDRIGRTENLEVYRKAVQKLYQNVLIAEKPFLDSIGAVREDYRKNGPDGYDPFYKKCFPEVFPNNNYSEDQESRKSRYEADFEKIDFERERNDKFNPAIYEVVDVAAQFPGGENAMLKYFSANLNFSGIRSDDFPLGKCYIVFVVSEHGNISNVKVQKGYPGCEDCDKEVIRVAKEMPNWIPAKIGARKVNSFYRLPIIIDP